MTTPLPAPAQDPAILRAMQTRAAFDAQAQQVRANVSLADVDAAQLIVDFWNTCNADISTQWRDLEARRRARADTLQGLVPVGPPVTDDTSPADTAVIQQAFRGALAQARSAMPSRPEDANNIRLATDTLDGMLADAERFDDDIVRRAVLTAAMENGHLRLVRVWTDRAGLSGQLDELDMLLDALAGRGVAGLWNKEFKQIPKPREADELPRLLVAQQAMREEQTRQAIKSQSFLSPPTKFATDPPVSLTLPK